MAEIFPNEGLDLIYAGYPKGATGPANTWLGLFTAFTASTVGTSAAVIASWTEVANAGAYTRQTISSASWHGKPRRRRVRAGLPARSTNRQPRESVCHRRRQTRRRGGPSVRNRPRRFP